MFPQKYPIPEAAALYDDAKIPSYGLAVLRLVAEPCVDEEIRISAALNFINHIKVHWSPAQPVSDSYPIVINPISVVEEEDIKTSIVSTMIRSSPIIRSQLCEAISVIGHHDFPKKWPTLLPEIVAHLNKLSQDKDYALINLLLASINSLFMKFQSTIKTEDLLLDLKYCLDNFAEPLYELFKVTACLIDQVVDSGKVNVPIIKPYLESQRLCCSVFYSFNYLELHDFFTDNMSEWAVEFQKYLTCTFPAFEDYGVDRHLHDELRVVICENISLYVIKEEDLIKSYLSGFVLEVLNLLVSSSSHGNGREQLTVTTIKFLTAVCKSGHYTLFSGDDVLAPICESIITPNVMLLDDEEELFETDPVEFVMRDLKGRDLDTKRGIACELLKGIAMHYKNEIRNKVGYLMFLCGKSLKYKYCAMSLAFSLAIEDSAAGTSVSTELVDVKNFYQEVICEQLKDGDVTSFPMIKAGALKFFMLFGKQILEPRMPHTMDFFLRYIPRFLTSPSYAVTSYAARCIDKFFHVLLASRYASRYIHKILPMLISNLFGALSNPESEENQHVMKCIARVVRSSDLSADIASLCLGNLTTILDRVCQDPQNPLFNSYLFKSLSALIRRVCVLSKERTKSPLIIILPSELERKLCPILQMILARDIREFFPYAYMLLAKLVDLRRPLLPKYYTQVFDILRLPDTWTSLTNFPGKVFLQGTSHEVNLCDVHGIYDKLVSSLSANDHGYCVLNTVIENLGFEVISPFVISVWVSLFNRLQNKRRVKSVENIIMFMSLFLVKDGPENLVNSVNAVRSNAFQEILEHVLIPNLKLIKGPIELKLTLVASTRLICECLDILGIGLWGKMFDRIMTILSERVEDEPEFPVSGETVGADNATTFACIYENAEDILKEIKDPKQYLVDSLSNLFAASPQTKTYYHQAISESLGEANHAALLQLFSLYNVSFF